MRHLLESAATWVSGTVLSIGAKFDPEVLQWPGGSVLAMLFCIYATIARYPRTNEYDAHR
jgi:hypothetical protein